MARGDIAMSFMPEAEIARTRRHFLALRAFYGDMLSDAEEIEIFGRRRSWIERRFLAARRACRRPLTDDLRGVWVARLRTLYARDDDAAVFLERPHPALDGKTARAAIEAGRGAEVEIVLRQIEDGVYV